MSRVFIRALPASAIAIALGCGGALTAPDLVGVWGGEHLALEITASGATLEYDCAHGSIDEPISPGSDGSFDVRGVHVFEHGGPVREDEPLDDHPARYLGRTDGHTMTLDVTLLDSDTSVGTFFLVLDEPPRIFKCL